MIISTGMADLAEITDAVECARDNGCDELVLLHCISSYPAPIEQANLKTITDLEERFNVVTGLSDHTMGSTAAVASVALGACFIEKHVTLSRNDKGPDSAFSLEPDELRTLCEEAHNAWLAMGVPGYELKPSEESSIKFRRSIYVVQDVAKGEELTSTHVKVIRPGYGLAPKYLKDVLGKSAAMDIERGTAINWEMIQ